VNEALNSVTTTAAAAAAAAAVVVVAVVVVDVRVGGGYRRLFPRG